MMNDYQILGIAENADPKEIKRAYFRLVRQYSPETDPERFQEIREAYEHLTAPKQESAEREENTLSYPVLPYSDELRKRILSLLHMGDYSQAAEIAEKSDAASTNARTVCLSLFVVVLFFIRVLLNGYTGSYIDRKSYSFINLYGI